ncbi:hypothetical protein A2574_01830 [Candidatus Shapirobacteria bacterium RIFOXYD1_FULL_38_32]|nr:MAG: Ribosomal RNA small subunit methyltransferase A [Candidatus Shapirobacteria bacterium GW2011_GWE2_38_30]KKQ91968.1 MAG: Ribosomal RNA small subunit methyltransferase A [Candidatus Shapirobacteria bacterium GW2011_GWE1_38_92]OGL56048.1 MAG: hypothetical protein A2410_02525 [Candidatus Shapirobacteria bacterium RIFOXYC1_FULL_38_24]OGL57002.1 MAG: hypothetical protein A2367_00725 [Candidatus Shapirobacteria bacterium RIFOXYB1_FULL_38_38]OGL57754.1 MAG: hypothetical protein A2574_01830 [Can
MGVMRKEDSFSPISEKQLKDELNFEPVEKLGQNFLVDPAMVKAVASLTIEGADVVEIGCGPGNITKGIAKRASSVIGLEIFPDFAEAQEKILKGIDNVKIVNQNALNFDFKKWLNIDREARHQVIGNIPFNISEPLLTTLSVVSDKIERITLLVGDNMASIMTMRNPNDDRYTRLSFICGIFDVNRTVHVPRTSFWPVPRTDADVISLSPKEYPEDGKMYGFQLRKRIILSQKESLTLAKVLNGFSSGSEMGKQLRKDLSHRYERRQINVELKRMAIDLNKLPVGHRSVNNELTGEIGTLVARIGLPMEILSKPFSRLNNEEVRQLAIAIGNL